MSANRFKLFQKNSGSDNTFCMRGSKSTYGIVATEDKSIRPEIEEKMYERSNTKVTKLKGSHAVHIHSRR